MKSVIEYIKSKFAKKKKVNPQYEEILKDEKSFLKKYKNATFGFFGYLMPGEELPFFEYIKSRDTFENGQSVNCGEMVRPFTPNTLVHCVHHLTPEQIIEESKDTEAFKKKCRQYAKYAKYQDCDWNKTINDLALFIATISLEYGTPTK